MGTKKYKIKKGAQVDQDMSFIYWDEKYYPGKLDTIFEIDGNRDIFPSKRVFLIAYGFGILGSQDGRAYGNGAIYVKAEDLIPIPWDIGTTGRRIAAFLKAYCRYSNPEAVSDERILAEFESGFEQTLWIERAKHLMEFAAIPHSPDSKE